MKYPKFILNIRVKKITSSQGEHNWINGEDRIVTNVEVIEEL